MSDLVVETGAAEGFDGTGSPPTLGLLGRAAWCASLGAACGTQWGSLRGSLFDVLVGAVLGVCVGLVASGVIGFVVIIGAGVLFNWFLWAPFFGFMVLGSDGGVVDMVVGIACGIGVWLVGAGLVILYVWTEKKCARGWYVAGVAAWGGVTGAVLGGLRFFLFPFVYAPIAIVFGYPFMHDEEFFSLPIFTHAVSRGALFGISSGILVGLVRWQARLSPGQVTSLYIPGGAGAGSGLAGVAGRAEKR